MQCSAFLSDARLTEQRRILCGLSSHRDAQELLILSQDQRLEESKAERATAKCIGPEGRGEVGANERCQFGLEVAHGGILGHRHHVHCLLELHVDVHGREERIQREYSRRSS